MATPTRCISHPRGGKGQLWAGEFLGVNGTGRCRDRHDGERHFAPKARRGGKQNHVISIVFQLLAGKAAGLGETLVGDAIAMIFRSELGETHGCHGAG